MENTMDINGKQNLIFALDIGTRSVVGVVGQVVGDSFEVVDYERRFHAKRAMRDGQIEDITLVAKVVKDVRETLEKRLAVSFDKVSIAAAGRSLKTVKVEYTQEVDPEDEISEKLMEGAEYSALGKAMDEFSQSDESNKKFHCVGYSVVKSALDDYEMSNLVGHKGSKITMSLIVAFLPHNVVEGLYATMMINGLEVENLTLEPMAAIHVIVPKDIRLLNIALVDIGAGTSDIAICRNGGISAYDMVTVAGDELTEKIMHTYLVDFEEAENIKLSLGDGKESIVFKDVLGFETVVSKDALMEVMQPAISDLAGTISQRILDVNTISPVAVFVVGGGSQVSGLCEEISKNLGLSQNRVTVGGKQGFKYVKLCSEKLQSPEFVTPVGIGAILSERAGTDFFAITVNGNKIMLLRQGEIKVMEAILLAGIKPTALIGVPQRPISYTVNGEKHTFRLEYTTGEIRINGEIASIDSTLTRGDALVVVPAKVTKKEFVTLEEIKRAVEPTRVGLQGQWQPLEVVALVNQREETDDYIVVNGDEIVTATKNTLRDFCSFIGLDCKGKVFAVNGGDVKLDYALKNSDMLEYMETEGCTEEEQQIEGAKDHEKVKLKIKGNVLQGKRKISISVKIAPQQDSQDVEEDSDKKKNIEEVSERENTEASDIKAVPELESNIAEEKLVETIQATNKAIEGYVPYEMRSEQQNEDGYALVTINGKPTKVKKENGERLLFVNMLNYVNIQKEAPGENLVLSINSKPAGYTDEVKENDSVIIRWE